MFGGGETLGIANDVVTPPAAHADVARDDVFLVGVARLAMMRVDVDRARDDVLAGGVDDAAPALDRRARLDDRGDAARR